MYNDDGCVGITLVALLCNPQQSPWKQKLSLATWVQNTATSRVDMSTYMNTRNLLHVSTLKGCKSKQIRFQTNMCAHILIVYGHTTYPKLYGNKW
jgi:hypothetical protein